MANDPDDYRDDFEAEEEDEEEIEGDVDQGNLLKGIYCQQKPLKVMDFSDAGR